MFCNNECEWCLRERDGAVDVSDWTPPFLWGSVSRSRGTLLEFFLFLVHRRSTLPMRSGRRCSSADRPAHGLYQIQSRSRQSCLGMGGSVSTLLASVILSMGRSTGAHFASPNIPRVSRSLPVNSVSDITRLSLFHDPSTLPMASNSNSTPYCLNRRPSDTRTSRSTSCQAGDRYLSFARYFVPVMCLSSSAWGFSPCR